MLEQSERRRQIEKIVARSERRRQIEHDLDPTGTVRRLVYDGSGAFTVEEWDAYVDWLVAQQEQESDEARRDQNHS